MIQAPDGLSIAARDHGGCARGGLPTLVLVHGWACNQDFWAAQIDALSQHFRVVTLDLPGHGAASADVGARDWSMGAFGGDVVAVADALDLDEIVLIGHSMGGAVIVEAAQRLGSRCRLLLGVDTFNEAAFYGRRPELEIAERCAIFGEDFGGTMRAMVRAITDPSVDPAVVAWIGDAMTATSMPVAVAVLRALLAWDVEARWSGFAASVVTINSALLAARNELIELPRLQVHHMRAVGHFPMMEKPDAFNALALDILKQALA